MRLMKGRQAAEIAELGRRAVLGCFLAGLLSLASVLWSTPASAHTDLLQASPGPGQQAGGTIDFIDLVFVEPVSEVVLTVVDPNGDEVAGAMVVSDGHLIRYKIEEPLTTTGRYIVGYTMTSADGDFTEADFHFAYHPDLTQPQRLSPDTVPSQGRSLVAWVASIGLAVSLLGGVVLVMARLERSRAASAQVPDS